MRTFVLPGLLLALVVFPGEAQVSSPTNYFSVKQDNGIWWFVDPNGNEFISKGIDNTSYAQDATSLQGDSPFKITNDKKYGNKDAWRKAIEKRLADYGFNTAGAWSDPLFVGAQLDAQHYLAETKVINIGSRFVSQQLGNGPGRWKHQGVFPDVFDPAFKKYAEQTANEQCRADRNNPWLIGWFSDNELRWCSDWRSREEQLVSFLNLPPESAGHHAAVALLQSRYPDIAHFNAIWKTTFTSWHDLDAQLHVPAPYYIHNILAQNESANYQVTDPATKQYLADCYTFAGEMAEEYFRITTEAIKQADPHHLLLGCRFAIPPPPPVVYAAAKYLDVVSFNCYMVDPVKTVAYYAKNSGRPLLIGEFGFRAKDSGLPNTKGAGPLVDNEQERASAFELYVRSALSNPNLIGYHWFEHADEPKEGRYDGENSNYGIVDINDNPYIPLTDKMTSVNGEAEKIHQAAEKPSEQ